MPAASATESQRMRATGFAEMSAGNMAGARNSALDAALRAAVETASVRAFGSRRVAADPGAFRTKVLARPRDFVDGFQVVSEGVEDGAEGMRYRVVLEADVALALVEEVIAPPPAAAEPIIRRETVSPVIPPTTDPYAPRVSRRPAVELEIGGELTGVRYRSLVEFIEREVPGVESVLPVALEPGRVTLRVAGSFPSEDLGGYLVSANLPGFRLRLSAVPGASPQQPERLLVRVEAGGSGGWR